MARDQRLEFRHQCRAATTLELELQTLLVGDGAQAFQPVGLGGARSKQRHVRQRGPAP